MVDITKLAHRHDVKNDNFGLWSHSGSHPQTFKVQVEVDGYMRVEKCAPGATGSDVVYLRRLHSVHPSNNQFKRMIAFVSGECLSTVHVTTLMAIPMSVSERCSYKDGICLDQLLTVQWVVFDREQTLNNNCIM